MNRSPGRPRQGFLRVRFEIALEVLGFSAGPLVLANE